MEIEEEEENISKDSWNPPTHDFYQYQNQQSAIDDKVETSSAPEEESGNFIAITKPFQWRKPWRVVTIIIVSGDTKDIRELHLGDHPVKTQFLSYFRLQVLFDTLKCVDNFTLSSLSLNEEGTLTVEIQNSYSSDVLYEIEKRWKALNFDVVVVSLPVHNAVMFELLPDILQEALATKKLWMYYEGHKIYLVTSYGDKHTVDAAIMQVHTITNLEYHARLQFDPLILKLLKCEPCMKDLKSSLRRSIDAEYVITSSHIWIFAKSRIEVNLIRTEVYTRFACSCFSSYDSSLEDDFTKLITENLSKRLVTEQTPEGVIVATTKDILRLLWLTDGNHSPLPPLRVRSEVNNEVEQRDELQQELRFEPEVYELNYHNCMKQNPHQINGSEQNLPTNSHPDTTEYETLRRNNELNQSLNSAEKKSSVLQFEGKQMWSCKVHYENVTAITRKVAEKLPHLGVRFNCSLSVDSSPSICEQIAQWTSWEKGVHIVLVHGDYLTCHADVICRDTQKNLQNETFWLGSNTNGLPCAMTANVSVDIGSKPFRGKVPIITKTIETLLLSIDKESFSSFSIPVDVFCNNNVTPSQFCGYFSHAVKLWMSHVTSLQTIYICNDNIKIVSELLKELKKGFEDLEFYDMITSECVWEHSSPASTKSNMEVEMIKGDILEQQVDVVVNSVSRALDLTRGVVSQKLLQHGGKEIGKDLRAKYPNGISFGAVVKSIAGQLPFKAVFHVALPPWTKTANFSKQILSKTVHNCLTLANKSGFRSIAFPVFGTGTLLYPWEVAAETMFGTIERFRRDSNQLIIETVKIVLYPVDMRSIEMFENCQRDYKQIKLLPVSPYDPPMEILEARAGGLRITVTHMVDVAYNSCNSLVEIQQTEKGHTGVLIPKTNNLSSVGKQFYATFDGQEQSFKKCIKAAMEMTVFERISSLALGLVFKTEKLSYLKQAKIVKEIALVGARSRYLDKIEIVVADKAAYDDVLLELEEEKEVSGIWSLLDYLATEEKNKFRKVSNYVEIQHSSLIITATTLDASVPLEQLQDELQNVVQCAKS